MILLKWRRYPAYCPGHLQKIFTEGDKTSSLSSLISADCLLLSYFVIVGHRLDMVSRTFLEMLLLFTLLIFDSPNFHFQNHNVQFNWYVNKILSAMRGQWQWRGMQGGPFTPLKQHLHLFWLDFDRTYKLKPDSRSFSA